MSIRSLLLSGLLLLPLPAFAQSAQKYGVQGSAFTTGIYVNGGTLAGIGAEGQFRFNRVKAVQATGGMLSVGIGAQYTTHKSADEYTLNVSGAFIEPRLAIDIGSANVVPYLSARVAVLRQSSDFATSSGGTAFGAGGGIAYALSSNVNLDAGVAAVYQNFSDAQTPSGAVFRFGSLVSYAAKIGINIGFP